MLIEMAKYRILWRTPRCARALMAVCVLGTASGCAGPMLTRHNVDPVADEPYRNIRAAIDMADSPDAQGFADQLRKEAERRDLNLMLADEAGGVPGTMAEDIALLNIIEVERRAEKIGYRRSYGRTSLTQMRGRKERDVVVIRLRSELVDMETGQKLFQADYTVRDPWYAETATKLAVLASTLVRQLERDGLIASAADTRVYRN